MLGDKKRRSNYLKSCPKTEMVSLIECSLVHLSTPWVDGSSDILLGLIENYSAIIWITEIFCTADFSIVKLYCF